MNRTLSACALLASLIFTGTPHGAAAQSRPYTPKPGSFERKLIMDTLRVPVESKLHRPVIFQVTSLRAQNGWAFLNGLPVKPNGGPMDYRGTPYAQAARDGDAFSGTIQALLHKTRGKWRVVTYDIGASDVEWYDWDKRYHAPRAILGLR